MSRHVASSNKSHLESIHTHSYVRFREPWARPGRTPHPAGRFNAACTVSLLHGWPAAEIPDSNSHSPAVLQVLLAAIVSNRCLNYWVWIMAVMGWKISHCRLVEKRAKRNMLNQSYTPRKSNCTGSLQRSRKPCPIDVYVKAAGATYMGTRKMQNFSATVRTTNSKNNLKW